MLDCSYKYGVHNVCDSLFIVWFTHGATCVSTPLPQVAIPDRKKLPKKYFSRHCKLESTFPQEDKLPLYSVLVVSTQKVGGEPREVFYKYIGWACDIVSVHSQSRPCYKL